MIKKKKDKNEIKVPLYETNPIVEGEKGNEETLEQAVKMAKNGLMKTKFDFYVRKCPKKKNKFAKK